MGAERVSGSKKPDGFLAVNWPPFRARGLMKPLQELLG